MECETYQTTDIRDRIFSQVNDYVVTAALSFVQEGKVCGLKRALEEADALGLEVLSNVEDGMQVHAGETILLLRGNPKQIAMAEDRLIGILSKTSGIATAAFRAVEAAQGQMEIVCGSMKKIPSECKTSVRHAILQAGAKIRISEEPFIYLDKNYIRIFGSVKKALDAVKDLDGFLKVVQIRSEGAGIEQDTVDACQSSADILMIDTGNTDDIRIVLDTVHKLQMRDKVKLAFAGNVKIEDIPELCKRSIDKVCIGRAIADAPLLDMKLDVIDVQRHPVTKGLAMNLLEKSELWIEDVEISNVDLALVSEAVAEVLGMAREDILVVDVRQTHITLDILRQTVAMEQIAGKENAILEKLKEIPGMKLGENVHIHSNGVLGLIALDEDEADGFVMRTEQLCGELQEVFEKRACVFPTGFEVQGNMIEDTNSPYIARELEQLGYEVTIQPPLPDAKEPICRALENAMNDGYSLIVTTGGVGAEDKDFTVEAVLELDPQAATPWLAKYQIGTGRHVKQGVRIAVGQIGGVRIISMPGPNDEVQLATQAMIENLDPFNKYKTAQAIAAVLREKIKKKWHHHY